MSTQQTDRFNSVLRSIHHSRSICLIIGLILFVLLSQVQPSLAQPALWIEQPAATPSSVTLQQLNQSLQGLAATLLPAVVSLKVQTKSDDADLPDNHPQLPDSPNQLATGSGVIIRSDGLILTNDHVVENSIRINVRLYNGKMTQAATIGHDAVGDLALLRIDVDYPLPVAPLGHSSELQVGEFVVAFGSPFGFEHTMTFGVVSGTKRQFMRSGIMGGYIQTDASINIGNSGGPLVNMRGEVIGINTATVGRGELGFAIPSDAIKSILPQLYAGGNIRRGYLGVQIRPLDIPQAQHLGMPSQSGVYVHDVVTDHPAQKAGVIAGDVITRFNGARISTPLDLQSAVATTPVGKTIRIEVLREKAFYTMDLTVGEMPTRQ